MTVAEFKILKNDNGLNYEVVSLCEYNEVDKEYYKNSWQQYAVALLKQISGNYTEYVVARAVGDTSWGYGSYFEDFADALNYYNKKVEEYKQN